MVARGVVGGDLAVAGLLADGHRFRVHAGDLGPREAADADEVADGEVRGSSAGGQAVGDLLIADLVPVGDLIGALGHPVQDSLPVLTRCGSVGFGVRDLTVSGSRDHAGVTIEGPLTAALLSLEGIDTTGAPVRGA